MSRTFQETLFQWAIPLSILAILVRFWALWDCFRRTGRFKGPRDQSQQRGLRNLWLGILIASFLVGLATPGVVLRGTVVVEPGNSLDEPEQVRTSTTQLAFLLPLPFYRYRQEFLYRDGDLVARSYDREAVIPFPFILGLLAYLGFAIDWRPIWRRIAPLRTSEPPTP